ncbi:MAG: hypothetical protein HC824_13415 [Synechococcales cyanobacterium RM1_1_8]|nr:hypothetical protein [Synechococcales cyanobacterium RM1_1_8]
MKVHQSILNQAKQGDGAAIAQLMQAPLMAKGITVHAHVKNDCLHVDLIATPCPPKQASLSFVRKGIGHLQPDGIRAVRIDGYQTGLSEPGWVSRFNLQTDGNSIAPLVEAPAQQEARSRKPLGLLLGLLFLALIGLGGFVLYSNRSNFGPPAQPAAPTSETAE